MDERPSPWYLTGQPRRIDDFVGGLTDSDFWTPTPAQLELCWHIYVDNVDPIVRILHKPTVRRLLIDAQLKTFDELDTTSRALLLAICFSAISSLDPQRCQTLFDGDGLRMKQRCKRSVELAIMQARLIQTHDIQAVQAFTLFLVGLNEYEGSSFLLSFSLSVFLSSSEINS